MQIDVTARVENFFRLEAVRPDGSTRLLADWFGNLIVDHGLDLLAGAGSQWARAKVGTGSSTPSTTDTALDNEIAESTTSVSTNEGMVVDEYVWVTRVVEFDEGAAAGNLTEIGLGPSGELLSRALIKDAEGNPTTVTVLADERLRVSFEFRYHIPPGTWSGTVELGGETYAYTISPWRTSHNSSLSGWYIGGTGRNPAATGASHTRLATESDDLTDRTQYGVDGDTDELSDAYAESYTAGNHYRDYVVELDTDRGNFPSGLGGIIFRPGFGAYRIVFDPKVPKDEFSIFSLTFRLHVGRHDPE